MRSLLRWVWSCCSCLALSHQAEAVPETIFEQEFTSRILPAYWANGSSSYLTAADGLKIHYRSYVKPGQERALVILPGRTESAFKFAEFLHDIQDLNLAVFIVDHRGQGASGRETAEHELQYVQDFAFYRNDLSLFMKDVVAPHGFKEVYGFGHSMGANILSLFMVQNPDVFGKAVISSPMLDINPAPFYFQWLGYSVVSIACWLGFDKSFVPGHGPFRLNEAYRGTGSAVRYRAFNQLRWDHKGERVGGVSFRFAQKALEATWDMRHDADKLVAPILMFQAGNDDVVLTGGQDYVCQRAKQCRKLTFPEARHEIHIESDAIRDAWLDEIRKFLGAS
jgi:lysophospholipase